MKPGETLNPKGYPKGIPHRTTMLHAAVRNWVVEDDLAQLIEKKLHIKTKGKTFDRVLIKLALAQYVTGDQSLLHSLLSYQFLPLTPEACGLVEAAAAAGEGGVAPGIGNLNVTLNTFEQALAATQPHRPSFTNEGNGG